MKIVKSRRKSWLVAAVLAGSMSAYAPISLAEDGFHSSTPTAFAMAIDATVVRPLGLVSTVLGTGLFIVTLPFSAIGGNVDEAGEALVVAPAEMTFVRPLGHFDSD